MPLSLLSLLKGKDVLVGAIDVATDEVETPEDVAATIEAAMKYVPKERIVACTNCGMAPMKREIAEAKLKALGDGRWRKRSADGKRFALNRTIDSLTAEARLPLRPSEHVHQFRDLLALIGAVAGRDRALDAMGDMVAQHLLLDAPQAPRAPRKSASRCRCNSGPPRPCATSPRTWPSIRCSLFVTWVLASFCMPAIYPYRV